MHFRPALLGACALFLVTGTARAESSDWFGRDKMQHLGVSLLVSAGGYGLGSSITDSRAAGFAFGGLLALTLGGAKELYDLVGEGDPDWRDFVWDLVGATIGLLIAWAIDRCLSRRGRSSSSRPAAAFARSPP